MLATLVLVVSGFLQVMVGFGILYVESQEGMRDRFATALGWLMIFLGLSLFIIAGKGM